MKIEFFRGRFRLIGASVKDTPILLKLMGSKTSSGITFPPEPLILKKLIFHYGPLLELDNAVKTFYEDFQSFLEKALTIKKSPIPLEGSGLRENQIRAQQLFKLKDRLLLADDRGLGKSCTSIKCMQDFEKVLIVCPSYLKHNWRREILKWTGEDLGLVVIGERKVREDTIQSFLKKQSHKFLIVNYEMLRLNKCNGGYPELLKVKWDGVIADEAHRLKTPKSQQTLGAAKLITKAWILATGSPVANNPQDIWSLIHLLDPKRFSSFWTYIEYFCEIEDSFYGKEILGVQKSKIKEHQWILAPLMQRTLKTGLPEKIHREITFPLEGMQLKAYNTAKREFIIHAADGISVIESKLEQIIRLHQIVANPSILNINAPSAVVNTVVELVRDIDDRVIIGCYYKKAAEALSTVLEAKGFYTLLITGDTRADLKDEIVETFKKVKKSVLVGTLMSMGEGLSIDECNHMIFTDKSYTISHNDQFEDRIHRLTSTEPKHYYHLIPEKTINEKREVHLAHRKDTISNLLSDKAFIEKLWEEEFAKE